MFFDSSANCTFVVLFCHLVVLPGWWMSCKIEKSLQNVANCLFPYQILPDALPHSQFYYQYKKYNHHQPFRGPLKMLSATFFLIRKFSTQPYVFHLSKISGMKHRIGRIFMTLRFTGSYHENFSVSARLHHKFSYIMFWPPPSLLVPNTSQLYLYSRALWSNMKLNPKGPAT